VRVTVPEAVPVFDPKPSPPIKQVELVHVVPVPWKTPLHAGALDVIAQVLPKQQAPLAVY